ncbi:MAG: OB-fold domain-containing protein [Rhodovarius sp.]|nr:OB-fold domain-containing protein [Rhodovarius sp.]MCX7932964.1 OB-fold domain-containing protein [Rhodovarius sp.]
MIDVWSRPFWQAARERRFILPRCRDSGRCFFPPAPVSPFTGRPHVEWVEAAGEGSLWSFVVFHQTYFDDFPPPYAVVMVELDEGPMFLANLRGADPSELSIGQRMRIVFDEERNGIVLPQFEIVR